VKIKQLVWTQLPDYLEDDMMKPGWWVAQNPLRQAAGCGLDSYKIHLEPSDGKYYPLWDTGPGYELLEDAMAQATAEYETAVLTWVLEDE